MTISNGMILNGILFVDNS